MCKRGLTQELQQMPLRQKFSFLCFGENLSQSLMENNIEIVQLELSPVHYLIKMASKRRKVTSR